MTVSQAVTAECNEDVDVNARLDWRRVVVALDVDGVVVDPLRGGAGDWTDVAAAHFGIQMGWMHPFFQGPWSDVVVGRQSVEAALDEALRGQGWSIDAEEFLTCWLEADAVLHEHVIAAVAGWAAAGAAVALVTNQEHRRAAFLRELLGPSMEIASVVYSAELGVAKPHPEFFLRADRQIRTDCPDAESVVFIDDSEANVRAALAHGWTALHFSNSPTWQREVEEAVAALA